MSLYPNTTPTPKTKSNFISLFKAFHKAVSKLKCGHLKDYRGELIQNHWVVGRNLPTLNFILLFLGSQLSFPDVVQESIKLDFKLGSKHTALLESPERYFSGVILVALENCQKVLFSCLCIVTAPGHSLP